MLGFRIRSPDRDRQTDTARMQKLRQVLLDLGAELASEKAGFQNRYEAASADAAFSQQVYEDGRGNTEISARVDDLTSSLINYSRRIAALDRQNAFVDEMLVRLDAFVAEIDTAARPDTESGNLSR
jgi:hypothetical protein